jgi:hypothetical protein
LKPVRAVSRTARSCWKFIGGRRETDGFWAAARMQSTIQIEFTYSKSE